MSKRGGRDLSGLVVIEEPERLPSQMRDTSSFIIPRRSLVRLECTKAYQYIHTSCPKQALLFMLNDVLHFLQIRLTRLTNEQKDIHTNPPMGHECHSRNTTAREPRSTHVSSEAFIQKDTKSASLLAAGP